MNDGQYLDGPSLVEWIGGNLPPWSKAPKLRQWIYRCANGQVTKAHVADRYLIDLGQSLGAVPEDCFASKGKVRP